MSNGLMRAAVALLFLALGACASSQIRSYTISGADFPTAYAAAQRAATELGMNIYLSDATGGTFYAHKMGAAGGLGPMGELNFVMTKNPDGTLNASISSKASGVMGFANPDDDISGKFVAAMGRHVRIRAR